MPINNNLINKIRYTIYAPVYDRITKVLEKARQESITSLKLHEGSKVLIVGGGTGLDFPLFPPNVEITATDLTPAMVKKMKQRSRKLKLKTKLYVMDGQKLTFENDCFDVVILHLILAVIPDPIAAIKEAERVLKPDGQIAILDKFIPEHQKAGILRLVLNQFTKLLFSDINRKIEDIIRPTHLKKQADIPAKFGGVFRRILLRKPAT